MSKRLKDPKELHQINILQEKYKEYTKSKIHRLSNPVLFKNFVPCFDELDGHSKTFPVLNTLCTWLKLEKLWNMRPDCLNDWKVAKKAFTQNYQVGGNEL